MNRLIEEINNQLSSMTPDLLVSAHNAINTLLEYPLDTGEAIACPYCGGKTVKNGKQCRRQRHLCKSCGTTFTCTVNTVMYCSKAGKSIWYEVIADTISFVPIDATADRLGLTHDRVFHMRHKVLAALENMEISRPTRLSAVTECDETYVLENVKGTKITDDYGREPRKHGAKASKRGISYEYICICTGVGREGGTIAVSVNRAKPDASEITSVYSGYLDSNMLVICDGLRSYSVLSNKFGCSVRDANVEADRFFHLNNANSFHSFIKQKYYLYRGVASKYLNRYNALFAKMYRAGKSCIDGIYNILYSNSENSYFSKETLKSLRLLDLG